MKEIYNSRTFYLFAMPSFLEGIARIFDFANALPEYNCSKNPITADNSALYNDWKMVGADLYDSFKIIEKRIDTNEKKYAKQKAG